MCELFGFSCNRSISIGFSWRGFLARGRVHRDGWGVAFYPDGRSICLIKESNPSVNSTMASFLKSANFVRGKIVISHVRWASKGEVAYRNTHPFVRELFGREWVFAHNGTLIGKLPNPRFYEPIGETDSEKAFCLILDRLRELGRGASIYEGVKCIEDAANEFAGYGGFNFLMSDGEHLYAFWSGYSSLYYIIRVPPHMGVVKLLDEDFEVDLSELKAEDEVATIIATRELTSEAWIRFPERRLMVFRDGLPYLSREQLTILKYVRSSSHRVSIRSISNGLGISIEETAANILELKKRGMLKQDGRDRVPANHPDATFYTNPDLRSTIDRILNYLKI
ncbi:MAG: class II glutamine amidotransferase [Candidatus Jordarchaeales archaeon]